LESNGRYTLAGSRLDPVRIFQVDMKLKNRQSINVLTFVRCGLQDCDILANTRSDLRPDTDLWSSAVW